MEGMQSTIYFLQQQLKEAKETIANLQKQSVEQKIVEQKRVDEIEVGEKETEKMSTTEDNEVAMDEAKPIQAVVKVDEQEKEQTKLDCSPEAVETAETVEASMEEEKEEEALSLRLSRRGRSTPTKSSSESPSKRGRSTRGQKIEVIGFNLSACVGLFHKERIARNE